MQRDYKDKFGVSRQNTFKENVLSITLELKQKLKNCSKITNRRNVQKMYK